jgi:hypothetical protein
LTRRSPSRGNRVVVLSAAFCPTYASISRGATRASTALHVGRRGGANALLHFGVKKTKKLRIKASFGANAYEAVLEPSAKDRLIFASEKAYYQGEGEHSKPYDEDLGEGQKESGLEEQANKKPNKVADHVLKAMRGWKVFQSAARFSLMGRTWLRSSSG